jgi:hypothetical protein
MFTHTFEIETADTGLIEGEMSFNGPNNQPPRIKITSPLEEDLDDYKGIGVFLDAAVNLFKSAGEIEKISIEKK